MAGALSAALEDPLLKELNGALERSGAPTPLDPPAEQPLPLDQQLETAGKSRAAIAAASTPKAALLDKTLSKAAGGHGYRVVVEGEYYAKSTEAKGHVVKKYSLPFNLPALTNQKNESALGMIVGASRPGGGMLKRALKKFDPLAETYRTHTIVSVEALHGAPPPTGLQYMDFDALKAWVRENMSDFPVDVDEYWDANDLREDVIDFKTNAADGGLGAKKSPSERILERHEARKEEKVLNDMNEGV